ncbi:Alcohol dehydrogenase class-3-like protein [Dinothrombium tinctorium]|uniref:Alcohol dehydrogenase class-3-like protein n=1 Tax=Dinothrombium tinctorium TaxID=1965070 RepID=A0A3S3PE19_9ACAR|nr:Alcohol dehydrogenase class-3-like protein [Dinothrombium tinctorium]
MSSDTIGKLIKCRAAICWEPNKPLTIEEIDVEPPKIGEVRIKVIANNICHSDLHVYDGHAVGAGVNLEFPCILGHEATGVVESVGDGVKSIAPGDYVATLFAGQCEECALCENPKTNLCLKRKFDETLMADKTSRFKLNGQIIYKFVGISSLSEYTVISEVQVVKINPKVRMDRACIFSCGFTTGYGSVVNVAKAEAQSTIAVWGMGTVGLAAVYGARKCNAAMIIGVDTNGNKEEIAKKMGCTHFINPLKCREENKTIADAIKQLTNGVGVDYAIECVGQAACVQDAFESIAPWGTTVVVGVCSAEKKLEIHPNEFLSGKKLTGALLGGYKSKECVPHLIQEYVDGKLDIENLFTGSIKLDEVNSAFQWLKQGKVLRTVVLF